MPRGGARTGAGRKPKIFKDLEKTVAEALFSELGGESKAWEYLISHARQQQVDVGLDGLAERLAEARKRRCAEQDSRLLPASSQTVG